MFRLLSSTTFRFKVPSYQKRTSNNNPQKLQNNHKKILITTTTFFVLTGTTYYYTSQKKKSILGPFQPTIEILKLLSSPPQLFQKDSKKTTTLDIGPWQIPHDKKLEKGGEDTYFISKDGRVMGVFDGVGGWSKHNVDPREYSYALSMGCKFAVDDMGLYDPLEILEEGYKRAKGIKGSSTAVVVSINSNQLKSINLGDSGFMVIRNHDIIYRTKEQQHRFNMPYQIGSNNINVPSDGDISVLKLLDKDIIILATDGVLDNLFDNEILQIVVDNSGKDAQRIAEFICSNAYTKSKSKNVMVPFNENALHAGLGKKDSGKKDDITTLVVKYCNSTTR